MTPTISGHFHNSPPIAAPPAYTELERRQTLTVHIAEQQTASNTTPGTDEIKVGDLCVYKTDSGLGWIGKITRIQPNTVDIYKYFKNKKTSKTTKEIFSWTETEKHQRQECTIDSSTIVKSGINLKTGGEVYQNLKSQFPSFQL